MTATPAPRRIEWTGPEGWTVWADEDGCHVRSPHGDALEQPDVERLLTLWEQARQAWAASLIPAPRPPGRDEVIRGGIRFREQQIARRVIRAVRDELDTDNTPHPPF